MYTLAIRSHDVFREFLFLEIYVGNVIKIPWPCLKSCYEFRLMLLTKKVNSKIQKEIGKS